MPARRSVKRLMLVSNVLVASAARPSTLLLDATALPKMLFRSVNGRARGAWAVRASRQNKR